MSTIYLDPVQMDATAGAVGEHAREAEVTVTDLETTCSADVPASLAGWLADELHEIAVHVRMVALLYTVAALDTALRAQQISADQSLAAAVPALASTSPAFSETVIGGFSAFASSPGPALSDLTSGGAPSVGGFFLGASTGVGGVEMRMQSAEEFRAANPLLAAAENLQHTNPAASAQLFGLHSGLQASHDLQVQRTTLSRPGATYIGEGSFRGLDGTIGTQIYRHPNRPGEYLVGG